MKSLHPGFQKLKSTPASSLSAHFPLLKSDSDWCLLPPKICCGYCSLWLELS